MSESSAFTDYQRGVIDGVRRALKALDGHGFHDTAHDRLRRLLACDECSHLPEQHRDGQECLGLVSPGRGQFVACPCAEYEPKALTGGSGPELIKPAATSDPSAPTP